MEKLLQNITHLINTNAKIDDPRSRHSDDRSALDIYVQQIEDYLYVLEDMVQTLGKTVKQLRHQQQYFQGLTSEEEQTAIQFSLEGKTSLARAARSRGAVMQQATEAYQTEAELQNERFLALMDAKLRLEARLTVVNQQRALMFEPAV